VRVCFVLVYHVSDIRQSCEATSVVEDTIRGKQNVIRGEIED
jgi:hypothetical protein